MYVIFTCYIYVIYLFYLLAHSTTPGIYDKVAQLELKKVCVEFD